MQVNLDCVYCSVRQAIEAARLATADTDVQERIVLKSLELLSEYASYRTPAELNRVIHDLVKEYTGNPDPYRKIKKDTIETACGVYPALKRLVEQREDRMLTALEVSAVGNLLDAGVYGDLRTVDLEARIENELNVGFAICDIEPFSKELSDAETVVIIGDNTGETVLDRILISEIRRAAGGGKETTVYYGVRSCPIINDATFEDAMDSGLDHEAVIVSTGSSAPGLVLDEATPEFLQLFREADVVISKGQGNYETIGDSRERTVYFLLKAKCAAVAKNIGVHPGDYVFIRR